MSSVFHLLNSPHLVISEVFNMLELRELVSLSLCSTKTKSLIKFNWRKPEKLNVSMFRSCINSSAGYNYGKTSKHLLKVAETTKESENLENQEIVEINGCKVLIVIQDGFLLTYWNDEVFGLIKATEYFCDLFKTDINELIIGRKGLWAIDWINNTYQKPLPNAYIYQNETLSEEEYFKVLTECKVTGQLSIRAHAPKSFRFDTNLPKVGVLKVTHGHWVTIDHLLTQDCAEVHVERTKITGSDFNHFVNNWLKGKFPQLEYLRVQTENSINHFDVLDDLDYTRFDGTREYKLRDGRICTFFGYYVIQRNDGVTASIGGDEGDVTMWIHNKKVK